MTRLPMVPEDWLAPAPQDTGEDADPAGRVPDFSTPLSISGLLQDIASQPVRSTGLAVLMDPKEIATIPGLPAHYYEGATGLGDTADQPVRQDAGTAEDHEKPPAATNGQPASISGVNNSEIDGQAAIEKDIRTLENESVDRSVSAVK